jgi:hypothetical protein
MHSMTADRERFLALVSSGPMLRGDAIITFCGEDADPRVNMAAGIFLSGGAPRIVLSGGKHEPPRWKGAKACEPMLFGKGVAPDRIILESESTNTREQAVAVVRLACDLGWRRLLLVASSYHAPRAYLTFLKELANVGHDKTIQLVSVPCSQSPWFSSPAGMITTRVDLLAGELEKIDLYGAHVATYAEGLESIRYWESGPAVIPSHPQPPMAA